MIDRFAGDVNLENRLQKAARNIPQQQQMRAYSTTSRSSNVLRRSRHSRRTPLMSSTRSYATQTTNPNPPFGTLSAIRLAVAFYFTLTSSQVPKTIPIKRRQKSPLSVSTPISWRLKAVSNNPQALGVTPGKVRDILLLSSLPPRSSVVFQIHDSLGAICAFRTRLVTKATIRRRGC